MRPLRKARKRESGVRNGRMTKPSVCHRHNGDGDVKAGYVFFQNEYTLEISAGRAAMGEKRGGGRLLRKDGGHRGPHEYHRAGDHPFSGESPAFDLP